MKEEHKMKRIPYGIADFDDFRKSNLYYVGKGTGRKRYPLLKYSYLVEIKYTGSRGKKNDLTPGKIKTIKAQAESQLNRYCRDEKFKKAIGHTTLKKVVLIFCGTRLVYHGEI